MNIIKVYDILAISARMLRKDDMAEQFLSYGIIPPSDIHVNEDVDTTVKLDVTSYEYKLFMRAINNVYDDLITQYAPFVEEKTFTGNKIRYSDFERDVAKVIEVRNSKDEKPRYLTTSDGLLFASTDTYRVIYSYRNVPFCGDDIIKLPFISPTTFAYGISAEYCILDSLFDEANVWLEKYKEALQGTFRRTKNIKMRAKIWQ